MPDWKALVERARSLSIVGLVAGIFITWVGWFAASVITAMIFISAAHGDMWSAGQDPANESITRAVVSALIQLMGVAAAGFVATMLSAKPNTDHGIALGVFYALGCIFYVVPMMTSNNIHISHTEIYEQWVLAVLSVPTAWFGARKYLGS